MKKSLIAVLAVAACGVLPAAAFAQAAARGK
jgi:hypothetical protein